MTDRQAIELDLDEGDFINLEILGDIALDERDQKLSNGYRWLAKNKRVPALCIIDANFIYFRWYIADESFDPLKNLICSPAWLPSSVKGTSPTSKQFKKKSESYNWAARHIGEWLDRHKVKASDSETPQPVLSHAQSPSEQP